MKRRKARMKKAPILFICIILLGTIIYFSMKNLNDNENTNSKKLEELGYSQEEINIISSNNDYSEYAINNDYDKNFVKFISEEDFILENLDAYNEYLTNNIEASIKDTIFLVNNDIHYEYSDTLMQIVKEKYFLITRLDRYLKYKEDFNNLTSKEVVTNVNCNLDYDYYTNITPSDTSKGLLVLANKYYELPTDYNNNLVTMDSKYTRVAGAQMNSEAYEAFKKLSDDASSENLSILNQSAYRSYYTQQVIYNNYINNSGKAWTDKWSARPGHSEHQTGLATDVLTINNTELGDFENTKEYAWMKENSYKYGFILRYTEDTSLQTGYGDEPWHYRYVGIEAAKIIKEENITFDEYYAYYVLKK